MHDVQLFSIPTLHRPSSYMQTVVGGGFRKHSIAFTFPRPWALHNIFGTLYGTFLLSRWFRASQPLSLSSFPSFSLCLACTGTRLSLSDDRCVLVDKE